MVARHGVLAFVTLCILSGCTSVRVGPRVGTDIPAGSGGFNTVAGITAEGWYSPTGFVRIDPQVRILHSSQHVDNGVESLSDFKSPTIDADAQSTATFVELPIMMGFCIGDSSRLQPIMAFGGSFTSRMTSTTSTIGKITTYPNTGGEVTREVNETHSDDAMSNIYLSVCMLVGATYAATPSLDLRMEARGTFQPNTIPYWDTMYAYTGGSPYVSFYVPEFSASFIVSAVFHLYRGLL